jgi:hypothetical protein
MNKSQLLASPKPGLNLVSFYLIAILYLSYFTIHLNGFLLFVGSQIENMNASSASAYEY